MGRKKKGNEEGASTVTESVVLEELCNLLQRAWKSKIHI